MTRRPPPTASFTVGPFFPASFAGSDTSDLTRRDGRAASGQPILLVGRVLASGEPVRNAVVELWQPDARGLFAHPADPRAAEADPDFSGWGRAATNAEGAYRFRTIMPGGRTDNTGPARLPHVNLAVLASGLMRRLVTTAFFTDDPDRASDPVLGLIEPAARGRLVCNREPSRDEARMQAYRFDIVLRGPDETPFFAD